MKLTTFISYPIVGALCINFLFDTPFIHGLFYSFVLAIIWAIYQSIVEYNATKYTEQIETLLIENETLSNENITLFSENETLALKINNFESELKTLYRKETDNQKTIEILSNGEYIKNADWEVQMVGETNKQLSLKYENLHTEYNTLKEISLEKSIENETLSKENKNLKKELFICNEFIEKAKKANEMRSIKQKQNAEKKKQNTLESEQTTT